jgi:hypothetical protein
MFFQYLVKKWREKFLSMFSTEVEGKGSFNV